MSKKEKKRLDAASRQRKREARERRRRNKQEFMTIIIGGKQKRVRRPPTIDGLPVDEFIRRNADPIWLHQHEMWEYMAPETAPSAVRFEQADEHETRFDEYLEDLARWADEADFCEVEAGFEGDAIECFSDDELDDLPF